MTRWTFFCAMRCVWPAFSILLVVPPLQAAPPLREVIDAEIRAGWQRKDITPAGPAADAEFLRRVSLDLIGTIPTYDETVAFLSDPSSDKRSRLIDRLLDDPRYARHQADVWDLLLFTRDPAGSEADRRDGIQAWLQRQFAENTPYDRIVRDILQAEGDSVEQGAPLFLVQYRNRPEDATEAITQKFLGVQLQCARCHDHPYESWTQLDFYGMAAFLARLEVVTVGKADNLTKYAIGEKSTGEILFTGPAADAEPGQKGEPVKPKFLQGDPLDEPPLPEGFKEISRFDANKKPPAPVFSRKDELAEWVTRPDNPYFPRASANRLWAQFFGRGLIHPVDNMSESNTPSHPELLQALTGALMEHDFDIKWFIRELCNSQTYQLASAGPSSEPLPEWFQQARVRPLSAEELADAWRVATAYDAVERAQGKEPKNDRYRPIEAGYMLNFFGRPTSGTGDFQGGLHEHLFLNNGPISRLIATSQGGLHHALTTSDLPWDQRVDRLFLSVLNRPPGDDERQRFTEFLSEDENAAPERLREAIWALLSCSEFRFNH